MQRSESRGVATQVRCYCSFPPNNPVPPQGANSSSFEFCLVLQTRGLSRSPWLSGRSEISARLTRLNEAGGLLLSHV